MCCQYEYTCSVHVRNCCEVKLYSYVMPIQVLDFFIDNIFAMFGGYVFQHTVGFPMRTNCVPFFLYSSCFEADFMQRLLKKEGNSPIFTFGSQLCR